MKGILQQDGMAFIRTSGGAKPAFVVSKKEGEREYRYPTGGGANGSVKYKSQRFFVAPLGVMLPTTEHYDLVPFRTHGKYIELLLDVFEVDNETTTYGVKFNSVSKDGAVLRKEGDYVIMVPKPEDQSYQIRSLSSEVFEEDTLFKSFMGYDWQKKRDRPWGTELRVHKFTSWDDKTLIVWGKPRTDDTGYWYPYITRDIDIPIEGGMHTLSYLTVMRFVGVEASYEWDITKGVGFRCDSGHPASRPNRPFSSLEDLTNDMIVEGGI